MTDDAENEENCHLLELLLDILAMVLLGFIVLDIFCFLEIVSVHFPLYL